MGTDVTKHGDGRYIKYLLTLMPMEMHICKYFYVKSTIKSLLDIYALILIILCKKEWIYEKHFPKMIHLEVDCHDLSFLQSATNLQCITSI